MAKKEPATNIPARTRLSARCAGEPSVMQNIVSASTPMVAAVSPWTPRAGPRAIAGARLRSPATRARGPRSDPAATGGLPFPQHHLPHAGVGLTRGDHFVSGLLCVAPDVRNGRPVIDEDQQIRAGLQAGQRVLRARPGERAEQPAQVQRLHQCSFASSSSYCFAESSSAASPGAFSSISIIHPFSCGSSLIPSGASTKALLTLVTLPLNGANSSLTALVLSTTPNGWPLVTAAPTSGNSR